MTTLVRSALAGLALTLMLAAPATATEPAPQTKGTEANAPAAVPAAADEKGPGCMPGGECCGSAACAQAAAPDEAAAATATDGCPCRQRRRSADKPS